MKKLVLIMNEGIIRIGDDSMRMLKEVICKLVFLEDLTISLKDSEQYLRPAPIIKFVESLWNNTQICNAIVKVSEHMDMKNTLVKKANQLKQLNSRRLYANIQVF